MGLQLPEEKSWSHTIVCLDSQQAMNTILNVVGVKDDNYLIVKQCREFVERVGGLKLEFGGRVGNKVNG